MAVVRAPPHCRCRLLLLVCRTILVVFYGNLSHRFLRKAFLTACPSAPTTPPSAVALAAAIKARMAMVMAMANREKKPSCCVHHRRRLWAPVCCRLRDVLHVDADSESGFSFYSFYGLLICDEVPAVMVGRHGYNVPRYVDKHLRPTNPFGNVIHLDPRDDDRVDDSGSCYYHHYCYRQVDCQVDWMLVGYLHHHLRHRHH